MDRIAIADRIMERLEPAILHLQKEWYASGGVRHFVLDDVLPEELAMEIRREYPEGHRMRTLKTLREVKHIAAQMDQYNPILEEALFAFQDPRIVQAIGAITGLRELEPDELLYAGGISMMSQGHFLNPHIDNSHDKERARYRVLNILYYVSPNWSLATGGNLELWPDGVEGRQTVIESKFNRMVVMITNKTSWHSVSPVVVDDRRCCVSNYYFSKQPADDTEYFHVTSYRGRPEQKVRDLVLQADAALRMGIRKIFPKGVRDTKHFYNKNEKK